MSTNEFSGYSDDELVMHISGNAGASGAGAQAELTRRLSTSVVGLQASTELLRAEMSASGAVMERMTRQLVRLTVGLVLLTLGLAAMTAALL